MAGFVLHLGGGTIYFELIYITLHSQVAQTILFLPDNMGFALHEENFFFLFSSFLLILV